MLAEIEGKTSDRIIYAYLAILSVARKCDLHVDMVIPLEPLCLVSFTAVLSNQQHATGELILSSPLEFAEFFELVKKIKYTIKSCLLA